MAKCQSIDLSKNIKTPLTCELSQDEQSVSIHEWSMTEGQKINKEIVALYICKQYCTKVWPQTFFFFLKEMNTAKMYEIDQ